MRLKGGGEPPNALKQKIAASFGSVDTCKKELSTAAMAQFGSGWVWLVLDGDKLKVVKTANADVPLTTGMKPLLTFGNTPITWITRTAVRTTSMQYWIN